MICASFLGSLAAFCATRLLYHIRFDLSRGFWKVFWKFFEFFSAAFARFRFPFRISRCALTLYHIFLILSRGFSKVFQLFSWYSVVLFPRLGASIRRFNLSLVCAALVDSRCLVDSSHIIALSFSFVKGFLESFCGLAVQALLYKLFRWFVCRLHNIPSLSPKAPPSRQEAPCRRGRRLRSVVYNIM